MVSQNEFDDLLSLAGRRVEGLRTLVDTHEYQRALGHAFGSLVSELGFEVVGAYRQGLSDRPFRIELDAQIETLAAATGSSGLIVGPAVREVAKLESLASAGRITAFFCWGEGGEAPVFLAERLKLTPVFRTTSANEAEQLSLELAMSPVAVMLAALNGSAVLRRLLVHSLDANR